MPWFSTLLLLFPLLACWRLKMKGWAWPEAGRIAGLFAAGLFAASPFLTRNAHGTGEAFNYSLAVADTIAQMRDGVFPVFSGQTEFAFTGRVHPLRTAVYYTHSAGLLDWATCRQLTYWQVQSLNLALSLMGAVFAAYFCLRRIRNLAPGIACLLACWYGLTPGLLGPAHGLELYMTVTAAPFLPLAVLGAALSVAEPRFSRYALMAIGLAGAWLAHPPVAAWTSIACAVIVGTGLITRRPRISVFWALVSAAGLGLLLAGWAFASVLTLSADDLLVANIDANRQAMAQTIREVTTPAFWPSLLPVQKGGAVLGDFQLGYAGWVLLLTSLVLAWRRRQTAAWALLAAIGLCLLLTWPVPWVHERLWSLAPTGFSSISNIWPMQRAYLVIATLVMILFGLCWAARSASVQGRPRRLGRIVGFAAVVALLAGWTGWQAWQFIDHGFHSHHSPQETARMHRPSNRALLLAYVQLDLPETYHAGPRDPELELRLLGFRGGPRVLADNSAPAAAPLIKAEGILRVDGDAVGDNWPLTPALQLEPGKRYRLHVDFLTPPFDGLLFISGPQLFRQLMMTDPLSKRGFGMLPGQSRTLPLWVDGPARETVKLSLVPGRKNVPPVTEFARFRLEEVEPARLPMHLLSLSPSLRCQVDAPEAGWLETPRAFIAGYTATVDGRQVYPRKGPDGLTLIPVPAGRHEVELRYEPLPILRRAAWISLTGWALLVAGLLVRLLTPPAVWQNVRRPFVAGFDRLARCPAILQSGLAVGLVLLGTFIGWRTVAPSLPGPPGPLQLKVALPLHGIGRSEPLLAAGQGPGSTIVFLRHLDNETIQLGVDVWGYGAQESAPIKLDFSEPADIRITTGILYAGQTDKFPDASAEQLDWLLHRTVIWLNGKVVLDVPTSLPTGPRPRILTARQATGSRSHENRFGGQILQQQWLGPTATQCPLPSLRQLREEAGPLRLRVQLPPNQTGQSEPLVTFGDSAGDPCVFVQYLDDRHMRLGIEGPAGTTRFSEPLPVDYAQPQEFEISHPGLYPDGHAALRDYSPQQQERLRTRLRVGLARTQVLSLPVPGSGAPRNTPVRIGANPRVANLPLARFSGRLLSTSRAPLNEWPVPPGRPEAAVAADAIGALEMTVRLPADRIGLAPQALLTTGRAGEGMIVMVQCLDRGHLRLGADVWGKALFWSEPIAVDYAQAHVITLSASALYPADHPAARNLAPAELHRLRNRLSMQVDGRTVMEEKIFAYDAAPGQITAGASTIGGSYAEPVFSGEILLVRRLPLNSPHADRGKDRGGEPGTTPAN